MTKPDFLEEAQTESHGERRGLKTYVPTNFVWGGEHVNIYVGPIALQQIPHQKLKMHVY